jgi:hypothetical protein
MSNEDKALKVTALLEEYRTFRDVALAFDTGFMFGCLLQWVGLYLDYAKVEFAWIPCVAGLLLALRSMFGMFEKFEILRECANEIRALVGAKDPDKDPKKQTNLEPGDRLFRHDRKDINNRARQVFDVAFMGASTIVGLVVIIRHFVN